MNHIGVQQVAVLLTVAVLILAAHRLFRFGALGAGPSRLLGESKRLMVVLLIRATRKTLRSGMLGRELSHLLRELQRHMPVYSAQTIHGKEAEFIRDSLPKRFPIVLVVVVLFVAGAVGWWLSR